MQKRDAADPAKFIVPLNMNGLVGRMLVMPPTRNRTRDILFIYGHHSTIERWYGLIQVLSQYGTVTAPDLPGFGGMDSLYKIGQKPTIDALADYLAAFIKLRYKRRRLTVVGLSFGFVVVTRMLQRYPELTKRVDVLISIVGFAHKDDFTFSRGRRSLYIWGCRLFSLRAPGWFYQNIVLQPIFLRNAYNNGHNARERFEGLSNDEFNETMATEIMLWQVNDARTWAATVIAFLKLDNCQVRLDLPVWHVSVKADHYFDQRMVEQHYKVIFSDFHGLKSNINTHAPSVIADAKTAAPLVPPSLRRLLSKP